MSNAIDVLLVTQLVRPGETGDRSVHQPLRLEVGGRAATLPVLRALARGAPDAGPPRGAPGPAVLTPFLLRADLERRGLTVAEVPCLATDPEAAARHLAAGVGVVALCTTWLPTVIEGAETVRAAARQLKSWSPQTPILAGGVAVRKAMRARALREAGELDDLSAEELARHFLLLDHRRDAGLDALAVGEAPEVALAAVASRIKVGVDPWDLPNLALPATEGYRFTPAVAEVPDLDGVRIDWARHADRVAGQEVPIRTGVGCPHRCAFCDFTGLYRYRVRSLDSVLAELRTLAALPAPRRVVFIDDNLAVNRRRLVRLARALIDEDLGLSWRAFLRADTVDAEVAGLLRAAGCRECLLGIESGDPEILANMDKRLDPEQAQRAVELLDAEGVATQSLFVVGFPGECARSLERTARLLSSYPAGERAGAVHRYYLFRFEVSPLCAAARPARRRRFGLTGLGERWAHRTMDADGARDAVQEIFRRVRGPSFVYLEHPPVEWAAAPTRRVLETRDQLQRARLAGTGGDDLAPLLAAVRAAEGETGR